MDYNYSSDIVAVAFAMIGVILVIALVIYILQVIGMWKVFKNSG